MEKVPDADAEASTDVYGQAMWVQPLAEPHLEFIKGQTVYHLPYHIDMDSS